MDDSFDLIKRTEESEQRITKRKAFGTALVGAAKEQHDEHRKQRLMQRVEYIHDCIQQAQGIINQNQLGIDFFEAQLKALKDGEFIFGTGDEIVFKDEKLRKMRAFT